MFFIFMTLGELRRELKQRGIPQNEIDIILLKIEVSTVKEIIITHTVSSSQYQVKLEKQIDMYFNEVLRGKSV